MRILITILAVMLFCGCACTDMNHMATTNWVDRHVVPENKVAQWTLTPVLVPMALVTLTVDNFIIAPVVHIPSAYKDAGDFFTYDLDSYYTEMGVLPIRVALTPVVFIGSELIRTAFAVDTRSDAEWDWPDWGILWVRDHDGKLLGPSTEYRPRSKEKRQ